MKRDNFEMRIDEIRELATKYSKNDIARMVQMGLIEPQKALMAGMMIDRIAKSAMEPPQTTVAQDVFEGPPPPPEGQPPEGIMAAPNAPAPSSGVAALPSGIREMAGGGIVAFAGGGDTDDIPGYADGTLVSDTYYDPRRYMPSAPQSAAPVPSAAAPTAGLPTLPGGFKLRDYAPMDRSSLSGELEQIREAERLSGVDTAGLIQQMREEEQARRDELKGRREEAKGEAIMMAGLGLLGARRGQEFQVLAGVSRQALAQYSGALRDIRDTEKDIKKTERELSLAEDKLKRDQSAKAIERFNAKSSKLEDLEVRKVDQYNKAVEDTARLIMDEKKVDKETATRMAIAQLESDTRIKVEKMQQQGAAARAAGKPESKAGQVTDKELQDAYEARRKGLIGNEAKKAFDAKYPTWREFAAEQRGQTNTPPQKSQYTEGQEAKDVNGRAIIYRNGKWVYK